MGPSFPFWFLAPSPLTPPVPFLAPSPLTFPPLLLGIMREPTAASSGLTYERAAILQWLHLHRVDPISKQPMKRHRLTPNLNLR